MIYRLRKDDGSTVYPFAKEQLRSIFSNTSFPLPIPDALAAEYGCLPVHTIERPEHDPRTQRLVEEDPEELEDGTLRQVLTVRDATEEEIAAWDASNAPQPDWLGFYQEITNNSDINTWLGEVFQNSPSMYGGIISGLTQASLGSPEIFKTTLNLMINNGILDETLLALLDTVGSQYNISFTEYQT
jgi:hypothetical protein